MVIKIKHLEDLDGVQSMSFKITDENGLIAIKKK